MKKYGFTLIELLAVIVVLAIIALITTPMIMNVIEKSKKGALEDSAYGLIDSANIYYANNMLEGTIEKVDFTFANGEQTSEAKLSYKGKIEDGSVKLFSDSKVALCITEGKYSALKNVNDEKVKVTTGGCAYNEETNTYETIDKTAEELAALKSLGNATANDIVAGKTAVVQGELVTGTLNASTSYAMKLGAGKSGEWFTYSVADIYPDYENLTADNFLISLDTVKALVGWNTGSSFYMIRSFQKNYDASTGTISIYITKYQVSSGQGQGTFDCTYTVWLVEE